MNDDNDDFIQDVPDGPESSGMEVTSLAGGDDGGLLSLPESSRRYFFTGIVPYDIPALLSAARSVSEPLGKVSAKSGDYIPRFFMDNARPVPDVLLRFLSSKAEDAFNARLKYLRMDRAFMAAAAASLGGDIGRYPMIVPDPRQDAELYRDVCARLRQASPDARHRLRMACIDLAKSMPGIPLDGLRRTLYIMNDIEANHQRKNTPVR